MIFTYDLWKSLLWAHDTQIMLNVMTFQGPWIHLKVSLIITCATSSPVLILLRVPTLLLLVLSPVCRVGKHFQTWQRQLFSHSPLFQKLSLLFLFLLFQRLLLLQLDHQEPVKLIKTIKKMINDPLRPTHARYLFCYAWLWKVKWLWTDARTTLVNIVITISLPCVDRSCRSLRQGLLSKHDTVYDPHSQTFIEKKINNISHYYLIHIQYCWRIPCFLTCSVITKVFLQVKKMFM